MTLYDIINTTVKDTLLTVLYDDFSKSNDDSHLIEMYNCEQIIISHDMSEYAQRLYKVHTIRPSADGLTVIVFRD